MNYYGIEIIAKIVGILPQILIIAAIICYLVKKSANVEGILLLIGAAASLLTSIYYKFIYPLLWVHDTYEMENSEVIQTILNLFSLITYFAYAIGFYILIRKTLKKTKDYPGSDLLDGNING